MNTKISTTYEQMLDIIPDPVKEKYMTAVKAANPENNTIGSIDQYKKIIEYLRRVKPEFLKESSPGKFLEDTAKVIGMTPAACFILITSLLLAFLNYGKQRKLKGEIDPKEMAMGIDVELEHVEGAPLPQEILNMLSGVIALSHFQELKKYYSFLKVMEEEGEKIEKQAGISDESV